MERGVRVESQTVRALLGRERIARQVLIWVRRFTCLAAAAAAFACHDPTDTDACDFEQDGTCWINLGFPHDTAWVVAISPWGVYASSWEEGVFGRDDETAAWVPVFAYPHVETMLPVPGRRRMLVGLQRDTSQGASLWATDDGELWVPWDSGLNRPGVTYHGVQSLAADSRNGDRLYMGASYSVLRSDNGGSGWLYVFGSPEVDGLGVRSLLVSRERPERIWGAVRDGGEITTVLRSDDGGQTWTGSQPVAGRYHGVTALAEDPSASDRIWLGDTQGLYRSDDAGDTWSRARADIGVVTALAVVDDQILVAECQAPCSQDPYLAVVYVGSASSGADAWVRVPTPEGLAWIGAMVEEPSGRVLVATRGTGVWRLALSR